MRKHIGVIVLGMTIFVVLLLYMTAFSVRWQEKALVINMGGQISREVDDPGLHWKWPFYQSVVKFDGRIRTLQQQPTMFGAEGKQTLIASAYINWQIVDARKFFESFSEEGTDSESIILYAEKTMDGWIQAEASNLLGDYDLSKLVTLNADQFKLEELERGSDTKPGMLQNLRTKASAEGGYGITILDLGIRKLGIPNNITKDVFNRMIAEREKEVLKLEEEGKRDAQYLISEAERKAKDLITTAKAREKDIKGQGDAKAAEEYKKFLDHALVANFLRRLETLKKTLSDRTTIILDSQSPPYELITKGMGVMEEE